MVIECISQLQKRMRLVRVFYCFEHNLLLRHMLEALGFQVRGLAARVLWNAPDGAVPPRNHMLLQVDLEGCSYLVDAGFGGVTLTGPLRLEPDIEQPTPHETFRVLKVNDEFLVQVHIRDEWVSLYRFGLSEHFLPDYEIASWYLSTHPESRFVNGLLAARAGKDCRYALRNNRLTVYHNLGEMERRIVPNVQELRETLENVFRITLPDVPQLETALMKATASTE